MAETEYKQRNSSSGRKNKSDEILKKFAGMMVKIIKKANANNWKKGWMGVNGSIQGLPQNISGRTYSGGNSFFLMFHTAAKGYKTPAYMTFKQAKARNPFPSSSGAYPSKMKTARGCQRKTITPCPRKSVPQWTFVLSLKCFMSSISTRPTLKRSIKRGMMPL